MNHPRAVARGWVADLVRAGRIVSLGLLAIPLASAAPPSPAPAVRQYEFIANALCGRAKTDAELTQAELRVAERRRLVRLRAQQASIAASATLDSPERAPPQ